MDEDYKAELDVLLKKAIEILVSHCDTIQIIVTVDLPDSAQTLMQTKGFGNYYARRGSCEEWLDMELEDTLQKLRPTE